MAIESFIKNSFRIQKSVLNSALNISNLFAARMGSVIAVNTPSPFSDYMNQLRDYGEAFRENYRETVNEGLDQFEALCFQTVKRNVPGKEPEKGSTL